MGLADFMIDCVSGSATYTVKRYTGAGGYVNGVWQEATETTFTITMSQQPLNGVELMNLPENQRGRHILRGYTETQLFTIKESESKKADRVVIDGFDYEVQLVEIWKGLGMDHYRVQLVRENP